MRVQGGRGQREKASCPRPQNPCRGPGLLADACGPDPHVQGLTGVGRSADGTLPITVITFTTIPISAATPTQGFHRPDVSSEFHHNVYKDYLILSLQQPYEIAAIIILIWRRKVNLAECTGLNRCPQNSSKHQNVTLFGTGSLQM